MPAITTVGDIGSGHDACAPTALLSGSNNCFINNNYNLYFSKIK